MILRPTCSLGVVVRLRISFTCRSLIHSLRLMLLSMFVGTCSTLVDKPNTRGSQASGGLHKDHEPSANRGLSDSNSTLRPYRSRCSYTLDVKPARRD